MNSFKLPPSRERMLNFLKAHATGFDDRKVDDQARDKGLVYFKYTTFINEDRINLRRYDHKNACFDFCLTDGKKVTGYMVSAMYFNAHNVY